MFADRRGRVVAAIWLLSTVAALVYALWVTAPFPYQDEWDVHFLRLTNSTSDWCWLPHNEHRMPLPRLIWAVLLDHAGGDARVGSVATVVLLAGLALELMRTAQAVRGRASYADLFFPLLLLNWGHYENLRMGYQVGFALTPCLALGAVLPVLARGWTTRKAWGVSAALTMLPFCGAHGLVYAPFLGLWLFVEAWRQRSVAVRLTLAIGVLGGVWAVASILLNYHPPAEAAQGRTILNVLLTASACGSLVWGWAGYRLFPVSLLAGTVLTLVAVRSCFRSGPTPNGIDRTTALGGLLAIIASVVALAGLVGWGRAALGMQAGFSVRYALLMAPLACGAFLASEINGGRKLPAVLAAVALVLYPWHARMGWLEARDHRAKCRAFATTVARGFTSDDVERHTAIYPDGVRLWLYVSLYATHPEYQRRPALPARVETESARLPQ